MEKEKLPNSGKKPFDFEVEYQAAMEAGMTKPQANRFVKKVRAFAEFEALGFNGKIDRIVEQYEDLTSTLEEDIYRFFGDFYNLTQQMPSGFLFDKKHYPKALKRANRLAEAGCSILIIGPTGSGKGFIAKFIHNASPRRKKPFEHVNCATLSDDPASFHSQLFGHVKGSYTGAHRDMPGFIDAAEGGTLFFDEIATLSKQNQAKLLTLLEDEKYYRYGSPSKKLDIRCSFVFATNENLYEMMADGSFRKDLYSRIDTYVLELEPLDSLKESIGFIFRQYLAYKFRPLLEPRYEDRCDYDSWPTNGTDEERMEWIKAQHEHVPALEAQLDKTFSPILQRASKVENMWQSYHWDGNMRQLVNYFERCIDLDDWSLPKSPKERFAKHTFGPSLPTQLPTWKDHKYSYILQLLQNHNWNQTSASRSSGLSLSTLSRFLKNNPHITDPGKSK